MQCLRCFRLIKYHTYNGIILSKIWLLGHCQEHLISESQICPWLFCSQWKLKGHHSPYDVVSTPLSFLPCFSTSLWQREWVRCWRTEMVFQAICQQVLNNNGICLLTNWANEFSHWAGHLCDFFPSLAGQSSKKAELLGSIQKLFSPCGSTTYQPYSY